MTNINQDYDNIRELPKKSNVILDLFISLYDVLNVSYGTSNILSHRLHKYYIIEYPTKPSDSYC
jgi:hypothetical protein